MSQNTELTVADVEQLVADFEKNFKTPVAKDIKTNDDKIKGLELKSQDRTYDLIAALIDLAETLFVENAVEGTAYRAFLKSRAQKPLAKGTTSIRRSSRLSFRST